LAVEVAVHPREGHQGEVRGVQLELDRHEDHQRVLSDKDSDRSDREEDPREHEEIGDRGPHPTTSRSAGEGAAERPASISAWATAGALRCASTIAATAATINSTEVTSKGKK